MKDTYDDEISLNVSTDALHSPIFLRCTSQGGRTTGIGLNAKKARKLAKKLLAAADELDGVEPHGAREIEDRLAALEEHNAVEYRALKALDPWGRIKALEAEQRWDREQITALLTVLGAQREAEAETEEGDGNATAVDEGFHYLLPRSWILDHSRHLNTSTPGRVVFEIPAGTRLADRAWDGRNTARKIRVITDDLRDALDEGPDRVSPSAFAGTFRPLLQRLYDAVGGA